MGVGGGGGEQLLHSHNATVTPYGSQVQEIMYRYQPDSTSDHNWHISALVVKAINYIQLHKMVRSSILYWVMMHRCGRCYQEPTHVLLYSWPYQPFIAN